MKCSHLEGHVLQEVRDAVVGRGLVPGAGVDPQPHGGGGGARVLGGHADVVVQDGHLGGRGQQAGLLGGGGGAAEQGLEIKGRFLSFDFFLRV